MIVNGFTPVPASGPCARVITSTRLEADVLTELCEGRALAVRVPDFYPSKLASELGRRLERDAEVAPYPLQGDARAIERFGTLYLGNSCAEPALDAQSARAAIERHRTFCHPWPSPIDLVRLRLDESWPNGATAQRFDDVATGVGFVRILRPGVEAKPHVDDIRWALPHCRQARALHAQLAANVYLSCDGPGGELELWASEPGLDAYGRMIAPGSYGLERSRLPAPDLRLTPRVGELILFRSTCIHAVLPSRTCRMSYTCSVGYYGRGMPLGCWS